MNFLFYFKDLFTALILRPLVRDPFRGLITILGVAIGVAVFLSIRLTNAQTMLSFQESVDLVLGKSDAAQTSPRVSSATDSFARTPARVAHCNR